MNPKIRPAGMRDRQSVPAFMWGRFVERRLADAIVAYPVVDRAAEAIVKIPIEVTQNSWRSFAFSWFLIMGGDNAPQSSAEHNIHSDRLFLGELGIE